MIYDHMTGKPLFRWLRKILNVNKPSSLPMKHYKEDDETWPEWDRRIKRDQPFGYFMTETLPDYIDNIRRLYRNPMDNISSYMSNRFRSKIHYLPTGLKPGQYHDVDTRVLYGLFQTFIDFIEIEKAGHNYVWDEECRNKYPAKWYQVKAPFSWFIDWRCPQAGLDRLEWEMSLDKPSIDQWGNDTSSPHQAASAKEQYELYNWWTVTRVNRKDSYSVMEDFYKRMEVKYPNRHILDDYDDAENVERSGLYKEMEALERQYEQEDDEMLMRLIKIRKGLWT